MRDREALTEPVGTASPKVESIAKMRVNNMTLLMTEAMVCSIVLVCSV